MIIEALGSCMEPYLLDGDICLVKNVQSDIKSGNLTLLEIKDQEHPVIHRKVGLELFKGDRLNEFDQVVQIKGQVIARLDVNKKWIKLDNSYTSLIHQVQAGLSKFKTFEPIPIKIISVLGLIVIGKLARSIQNLSSERLK